jgi:hypothetical protein
MGMPGRELTDRIAEHLAQAEAGIDAPTIAREFLRLADPEGRAAALLVRAMLSRDPRFAEGGSGAWSLARVAAPLAPPVTLVALDVPERASREPWLWRVVARPWDGNVPTLEHQGAARDDALEGILRDLGAHPAATDRAGALARWIGAQERLHGFPESDPVLIDLRAWAAMLDPGPPAPAPASGEPAGQRLETLAARLERVVEAARSRGLTSWDAVAEAPRGARRDTRAAVWEAPRALTPEMLESLPEEPGIYRFLARDRSLLYVGKSVNLRRRVASYFRPPQGRETRREALLREIHGLEVEPLGSELEALIREAREIARRRPPWNVQVRVEPDPAEPPLAERDLLVLLPGPAGSVSLFLMAGGRAGLLRLPAAPAPADLAEPLRAFYAGPSSTGAVEEIPAPERGLVRRWVSWEPPGIAVLRRIDFATLQDLAAAVARAAAALEPGLPAVVRAPRAPGPSPAPGR